MELGIYLEREGLTPTTFAETIEVSRNAVYRYLAGDRFPRREVMERIVSVTHGQVQPNDFFVLVAS